MSVRVMVCTTACVFVRTEERPALRLSRKKEVVALIRETQAIPTVLPRDTVLYVAEWRIGGNASVTEKCKLVHVERPLPIQMHSVNMVLHYQYLTFMFCSTSMGESLRLLR